MSVRVRYAPSPTGSPHVGNIRTALFNDLFARRHGGTNILRIEDTDRSRSVPGCEADIVESLKYVGIQWQEGYGAGGDCGPYVQSERSLAGLYDPHWNRLIESGFAYWAFDTPQELEEMRKSQTDQGLATGYFGGAWRDASEVKREKARAEGRPGVVRLRIPRDETIIVMDGVRGRIEYPSNTLDDPVLIKSDGMPTYHFAAMVDDHLMGVTHIFRGEEWLGSAPKHIVLFKSLGWDPPEMVHLPVIKGRDGSKLSKRHGDTAALDFRRQGYLGVALANFIALIGWSPGGDKEVMSINEMAEAFEIRGIQPSSGVFDLDKLMWMQGVHVRGMDTGSLLSEVKGYASNPETESYWAAHPDSGVNMRGLSYFADDSRHDLQASAVELVKERVTTLADFGKASLFVLEAPSSYEEAALVKWKAVPTTSQVVQSVAEGLTAGAGMGPSDFEGLLRSVQTSLRIEKLGPVVHPVRLALTGASTGPGLFELMAVLGSTDCRERLERFLAEL